MKSPDLFNRINLARLKALSRVGAMLHGFTTVNQARLEVVDFCCATSSHNNYAKATHVPNVVPFPDQLPRYLVSAKKALYVGRLDQEKLPTLKVFVALCREWKIPFDIVGSFAPQRAVNAFKATLPPESLLGVLDTREFLLEHGHKYLFIGGVGQVPLEAAAANLPALIVAHKPEEKDRSVFLSAENLTTLLDWNCVLRRIPQELLTPNREAFFAAVEKARKENTLAPLAPYRLREALEEVHSAEKIYRRYYQALLGKAL